MSNQLFSDKPYTFDRVVRIVLSLAVFIGLLILFESLSSALFPFFVALLMAYLINPLVNHVQKYIKKRMPAILVSLVIVSGVLAIFYRLVIPEMVGELHKMRTLIEAEADSWEKPDFLPDNLYDWTVKMSEEYEIESYMSGDKLMSLLEDLVPGIWSSVSGVMGILGSLLSVVSILLYFFFILSDYEKITQGWKDLIPERYKNQLVGVVEDLEQGMSAYFKKQGLIVVCVGILFAIGLRIIGLPMAITIGLFIGVLNFVPYLQMVGFIPCMFSAALMSLESGTNFWYIMGLVTIVFTVVQLIQEAVLVPKFMGDLTGLNPAVILLSLSIWGSLLGVLGMMIALPITTLIVSYYKRFVIRKE